MHPNSTKRTKTSVLGPMGWIMCVSYEKFRRDFVARTFALVRPSLHRVSYGNQTVPNAPKYYETHQNVCLASNGVDRVRSLRKILTPLRGPKFCSSSARFAPSFVRQPNDGPECSQIVRNASKHQFRVQQGGSGAFIAKIPTRARGTNLCTSSARFAPSFVRHTNGPERTQILRNALECQFRVQWGGSGVFVANNSDVTS